MTKLAEKILLNVNEALLSQLREMGNFLKPFHEYYTAYLSYYKISEETIKKSVPAAWFLKKILIKLSIDLILEKSRGENNEDLLNVYKKLRKFTKRDVSNADQVRSLYDSINSTSPKDLNERDLYEEMRHYFSYGDPRIKAAVEGYQYGDKPSNVVFEDLSNIVDSFSDPNQKFYLNEEEEKNEARNEGYDIEDYIIFPDGWKWVWKHTDKSEVEHKYGENCGNCGDSSHEFLSLREPMNIGGDWKIWATFSIDNEGYLVQRKGVIEIFDEKTSKLKKREGNRKPTSKLFPYIYELLKEGNNRGDIKGLTSGSGYQHEEDFKLEDLPEDQQEELNRVLDIKEYYESIFDEYEAEGFTDIVKSEIEDEMGISIERVDENYNWLFLRGGMPNDSDSFLGYVSAISESFYYPDFDYSYDSFNEKLEEILDDKKRDGDDYVLTISFDYFLNGVEDGSYFLRLLDYIWYLSDYKFSRDLFSSLLNENVEIYKSLKTMFEENIELFEKFSDLVYNNLYNYNSFIVYSLLKNAGGIYFDTESTVSDIQIEADTLVNAYYSHLGDGFFEILRRSVGRIDSKYFILLFAIFRNDFDVGVTARIKSTLSWEDIEETFYRLYWNQFLRPNLENMTNIDSREVVKESTISKKIINLVLPISEDITFNLYMKKGDKKIHVNSYKERKKAEDNIKNRDWGSWTPVLMKTQHKDGRIVAEDQII